MLATYELPIYILQSHSDEKITPLKLQKLLYYVKVWGIVAGMDLYQGEFQKWTHGPVNPDVYHQYRSFARMPIVVQPNGIQAEVSGQEKELIDFIVAAYLPFSAISLSALTHKEAPWQDTPLNSVISHDAILDFYSRQPFAKNFNPFDLAHKPYYAVQSNSFYAYVLDMTPEDADRHAQFPSFEAYLSHFKQAKADTSGIDELFESFAR